MNNKIKLMEIKNFKYKKEDGESSRSVFILNSTDSYFEGIDISLLTQEEQLKFNQLSEQMSKLIDNHLMSYRRFSNSKIIF